MNANADGGDGFLLMDRVESCHNAIRVVCQAEKHPLNPVLPLGDIHEWDSTHCAPWSSQTVIYDDEDQLFKAWYAGSDMGDRPAGGPRATPSARTVSTGTSRCWGLHEYNGQHPEQHRASPDADRSSRTTLPSPIPPGSGTRASSAFIQLRCRSPPTVEHGARATFSPGRHPLDGRAPEFDLAAVGRPSA